MMAMWMENLMELMMAYYLEFDWVIPLEHCLEHLMVLQTGPMMVQMLGMMMGRMKVVTLDWMMELMLDYFA